MLKLVWHDGEKVFAIHRAKNIIVSFNGAQFFPTMNDVSRMLAAHGLAMGRHDEVDTSMGIVEFDAAFRKAYLQAGDKFITIGEPEEVFLQA